MPYDFMVSGAEMFLIMYVKLKVKKKLGLSDWGPLLRIGESNTNVTIYILNAYQENSSQNAYSVW